LYGVHRNQNKAVEDVEDVEDVEVIMDFVVVEEVSSDTMVTTGMYSTLGGLIILVPTMLLKDVEETITMNRVMNQSTTDA
jgi:VIT1/CCC1 family predicted Fe2+/Mn2+ transporter